MSDQPLFRVVYVSRNTLSQDETEAAMTQILAASRARNAKVGVTGALLFSEDCFAQALEGPMEAVEAVFEHVQADDRHTEVVVLEANTVTRRDFPEWSMAYAGRCDADEARFAQLVGSGNTNPENAGGRVRNLLRSAVDRATPALA